MSDVDWLALWAEFAQATDNKQLEVAERIVYLDGRWDFTELSSSKLIAAARPGYWPAPGPRMEISRSLCGQNGAPLRTQARVNLGS
jgi:hypothetical protein